MRMLRAAADSSTRVRQRQEKLCRRWLTDAYGGRPVMKMALNEGDIVQQRTKTQWYTYHILEFQWGIDPSIPLV